MPPSLSPLPVASADFASIRRKKHAYVDKTAYVQSLLEEEQPFMFLARPRRFGKSLLASTLERVYDRSRADLFLGLRIHESGFLREVRPRPVFKLDMSRISVASPDDVTSGLRTQINVQCQLLGLDAPAPGLPPTDSLSEVWTQLYVRQGRNPFVVLLDEYDAPITRLLGSSALSPASQQECRERLREFYSVLKSHEEYIHFAFVTGITRFAGAGLFSSLNNLVDVSTERAYDAACGFTERENRHFLDRHIARAAANCERSPEGLRQALRRQYNGYRFAPGGALVYNPVSYLRALRQLMDPRAAQYARKAGLPSPWINTGKTFFLFERMKAHQRDLRDIGIGSKPAPMDAWEPFDWDNPPLEGLMLQTGFLTVKPHPQTGIDTLVFPNREVAAAVQEGMLFTFLGQKSGQGTYWDECTQHIKAALEQGDSERACFHFDRMLDTLNHKALIAENSYQIALHLVCFSLNEYPTEAEAATRYGWADNAIETRNAVYVFELKLDRPLTEVVQQLKGRRYGDKYAQLGKPVVGVALAFAKRPAARLAWDLATRNYEMQAIPLPAPTYLGRSRPLPATGARPDLNG